ncbi:unnamed protein product [Rotaria sp. Silwood1]|nr:unnamed protein product [Rotaria sp. Silwood1]CAF1422032.1 unnamed protein product [Rotaria sp. Silwood1]CAF1465683.1 unnamed protein product [Rotaria sp. Silwood1]CAF3570663.1 unnamed protein product [Rotaria sp. Silwood1]CAF3608806.1 unnamed protein product [Rotaria sp. Silwood1]
MRIRRDNQAALQVNTLQSAHGTVMVLAWMVFASAAILFARYGRTLRFGSKEKLLGEKNWFQIHRLIACLTTVTTLLGFLLILAETQGTWITSDEGLIFVHSVLGGIIVCCALLQSWMALFRCHPESSFRYIYNWLHRMTGALAFFLSIPTIFIMVTIFNENRTGMIVILSLWSGWVVFIVIILEIIQFLRKLSLEAVNKRNDTELAEYTTYSSVNDRKSDATDLAPWNNRILILFLLHIVISIALAIALIVLIWK